MQDLVTWLRAQLDQDEQTARAATPGPWAADLGGVRTAYLYDRPGYIHHGETVWIARVVNTVGNCEAEERNVEHITCWDPARVLAEIAAKRRIIDAAERYIDPHPGVPCTNEDTPWDSCDMHVQAQQRNVDPYVLRLLALPYADRPGYRAGWRP